MFSFVLLCFMLAVLGCLLWWFLVVLFLVGCGVDGGCCLLVGGIWLRVGVF